MVRSLGFVPLITALLAMIIASGAPAEPVKLGVTVQQSVDSPLVRNILNFNSAVEMASGGAVAFDVFDKGRRFADFEAPKAVGSGAIEMGQGLTGLYAGDVPAVEFFQLPFLFDSQALLRAATSPESEMRRVIDAAILRKTGARVLWWQPYGSAVLMSKGTSITNPQSLQDRNVRTSNPISADFVSICGGKPQVVSAQKLLEALQAGRVDSVMSSPFNVRERELWRETQFLTRIRHSVVLFLVIINEDTWQGMLKPYQEMMLKEARKAENDFWDEFEREEADAYRFAVEKGMTVKDITSDELIDWRVCSSDLIERFVDKLGDTAAGLMSAYGRLRATSCCNERGGPALGAQQLTGVGRQ